MKIIQKSELTESTAALEIMGGVATFAAAFLSFVFVYIPRMERLQELGHPIEKQLLPIFWLLLLPALLIAVSAYFHAIKQSYIGFGVLFICGGFIAFIHAISFLLGDVFEGRILIGILPGIFAALTLFFAFCLALSRINSPRHLPLTGNFLSN